MAKNAAPQIDPEDYLTKVASLDETETLLDSCRRRNIELNVSLRRAKAEVQQANNQIAALENALSEARQQSDTDESGDG